MKMKKLLAFSICVITLVLLTVTSVAASEIFISASGDDANDGLSESAPVATFEKAYALIGDENGTIKVLDNMTYSADAAHAGVVTVKGKTASVKLALPEEVSLNGKTTFETITLSGTATIHANGSELIVQSDVTSDSLLNVYGGIPNTWFSGTTSVKLYGGQYNVVYGGGYKGGASGSVVVLGGNANPNDTAGDNGTCRVYGGADHQYVTNTSVTLEGNAKTKYVYGSGNWGGSAKTHVYIKGGEVMNVFGGSHCQGMGSDTSKVNMEIVMTGGKAEALFGGGFGHNDVGNIVGDAKIVVKGGEVTRRIYTGTYNDGTSRYVKGTTLLVVYPEAKLVTKSGLSWENTLDATIFAGSRGVNNSDEINTMIFMDGCYDTFKSEISPSSHHNYIVKDTLHGDVTPKGAGVIYVKPDNNYVGKIGSVAYKNTSYTLKDAVTTVDFVKPIIVDAQNCTITVNVDQTIDLKQYADFEKHGNGYFFNGWKVNGAYVALSKDRVYAAKAGDVLTAVSTALSFTETGDIYTLGAQTRAAGNGRYDLRFVSQFSKAFLGTDVIGITTYGGANVQYGHIALPKDEKYMGTKVFGNVAGNDATNDNDISFVESEELIELGKPSLTGEIPKDIPAVKLYEDPTNKDYITFTVCITDIAKKNYDRLYSVRPYVKYTDGNGVERIIYGEQYSLSSVNNTLAAGK
jgi:hypothetical protein